ncbi:hypothetical protein EV382_2707 [Micromonospora violae]|uniref:Uncharacterized protein n=1 Tax=Micromonospora violae TaxID=1278207 RepID=A0A4Q7UE76_9ACTN|nr:hypothetical protein [Micromonospora violae]RZT79505.1 hypothetical protein EV382_2707 [Micromonospora violae]
MTAVPAPTGPFRWDLVSPAQLGALLDAVPEPDLWFLPELLECAGKVLARSANADLYFVGRSPDSIFDLLSGALAATTWRDRCHQVPLSLWADPDVLTPAQVAQFRSNLSHLGITPHGLAHRRQPVAFVDLVYGGRTYENLFHLLRQWISEERAAWSVIRTKVRFIGITARTKTSPNTWRWYQAAPWATQLPRRALVGVSLRAGLWEYFGDLQPKITRSFPVARWLDQDTHVPARDPKALAALAEAVAIVAYGRSPEGRAGLAAAITGEPTMRQPWVRSLVTELRRPTTTRQT